MNMLDSLTQRKWVLPGIALVVGLVLGVGYAWGINPVKWVEGTPEQLRADLQRDFLRMAIDSYSSTRGTPPMSEEEAAARMNLGSGPLPRASRSGQGADTSQEPLATFRTIYALGDDLYDDSFSIESGTGDFLGECGVGIGDVIGVGDPKKVSALEVWLFDKNDIQTVTKVLMSRYAFQDGATHNRLAAKGDPSLAESGGVIYLQTASLEVEARVVDLVYGEGALPPESFFERATIELRAWSRGS